MKNIILLVFLMSCSEEKSWHQLYDSSTQQSRVKSEVDLVELEKTVESLLDNETKKQTEFIELTSKLEVAKNDLDNSIIYKNQVEEDAQQAQEDAENAQKD